jgi:hypothetical protein
MWFFILASSLTAVALVTIILPHSHRSSQRLLQSPVIFKRDWYITGTEHVQANGISPKWKVSDEKSEQTEAGW